MALGQSVPLVDARARVTGDIDYALNLELPGMLHARFLRSPYAHARLIRVDTSRAEQGPAWWRCSAATTWSIRSGSPRTTAR
jgi:CO/xanthine dehydrogenase Mo-binding subunit